MKKADSITGIVLLVLSGYVIQESLQVPKTASFGPDSAFLPFWLAVILAALAVILIVSAWRLPKDLEERSLFPGKKQFISVTLILVGLGAYIFLMEWIGFIVDTFLLVAFLMKSVQWQRWPLTLLVAVLTTAALFIVFEVLLGVKLPSNVFGFSF